jgi:hypothetical protein
MRRILAALAVVFVAVTVEGQTQDPYVKVENPFQGEYALTLGAPLDLHVDVAGVRLATLTLTASSAVEAGKSIKCQAELVGENTTTERVTVRTAMLLEGEGGKALERINLDPFRPRAQREFDERQTVRIDGTNLQAAGKLYVYVELQP